MTNIKASKATAAEFQPLDMVAAHIGATLKASKQASVSAIDATYGKDNRPRAGKPATILEQAQRVARALEDPSYLKSIKGGARDFIKSVADTLSAIDSFSAQLIVDTVRDMVSARNVAAADTRAAESARKREQAAALNEAIRQGDTAAAAEAAGIAAADMASIAAVKRESAAERFTAACKSAVAAGIPLVSLFETLAAAAGIDNPVFSQLADSAEVVA